MEEFIKNTNIDIESIVLKENKDKNNIYFYLQPKLYVQLQKIYNWDLNIFDKIITSEEAGFEKPTKNFLIILKNL